MKPLRCLLIICGVCLASPLVFAQTFSFSLKSNLGSYLDSRDIFSISQDVPQVLEGKVEGRIGSPDAPDAEYRGAFRLSFDPVAMTATPSLREAWVKAFLGPVDLAIGNQIVSWGLTDIFTPVDVVNPRDDRLPIAPDKTPEFMGRANVYGNGFSFDLVVVPFWNGDTLPGSRWQGGSSPPPGVTIVKQAVVTDAPSATWDNLQFGGRFQASVDWQQGADFGFTCYRGFNTSPRNSFALDGAIEQDTTLTPTGAPGEFTATTALRYDRYSLVGVDADAALTNGLLFRTELAYKSFRDTSWFDPGAGLATAEWVAAAEYTLFGVKTIGQFVLDWTRASADDEWDQTILLIASTDLDARASLKGEGAWNLDGSGFLSPQLAYTIADGLQAQFSLFFFLGGTATTFGAFRDNDFAELSVKYSY